MAFDEAQRPIGIDSDTQGVAGHPPIVETIFKKIDASAVFVADLSFTGQTANGKKNPNPNVLIEYGWALKSLSYERIICVMNIAYGDPDSRDSELPFDLRHLRRPIAFNLPENATLTLIAEQKKKLTQTLAKEILASLSAMPPAIISSQKFLEAEAKDGSARFRPKGEPIGICWSQTPITGLTPQANKDVFLSEGSAMWFRLIPSLVPDKKWDSTALKKCILREGRCNLEPLYGNFEGYLRGEDGSGVYSFFMPGTDKAISIAFAFETGEIWSIDTFLLSADPKKIYAIKIEEEYKKALKRYSRFLKCIGISPPYRWIAGLTGVKNRHIQYDNNFWNNEHICVSDNIISEGVYDGEQSPDEALHSFFGSIYEKCGIPYPAKPIR